MISKDINNRYSVFLAQRLSINFNCCFNASFLFQTQQNYLALPLLNGLLWFAPIKQVFCLIHTVSDICLMKGTLNNKGS